MPADPLREKLKALVEEWRDARFLTYSDWAADQLAALLAESEPGMDPAYPPANIAANIRREEMANPGKTHYQGDDCPGGHESKCGYCGAKCERCAQPSKPKLKHRFIHVPGTNDYCGFVTRHHGDCGRTREAH